MPGLSPSKDHPACAHIGLSFVSSGFTLRRAAVSPLPCSAWEPGIMPAHTGAQQMCFESVNEWVSEAEQQRVGMWIKCEHSQLLWSRKERHSHSGVSAGDMSRRYDCRLLMLKCV